MSTRKRTSAYAIAGRAAYKKGLRRRPIKRRRYLGPPKPIAGYTRTGGLYGRFPPELKYFETYTSGTIDTTGEPYGVSINLVPQGTTPVTRVGTKFIISRIYVRVVLIGSSTVASVGPIKIALVLDSQANGAAAAFTDIFDTTTLSAGMSFPNLGNSNRFKIMKQWIMGVPPQPITTNFDSNSRSYSQFNVVKTYYKKCSIPIMYSVTNTDGAITGIRSNNLQFFAVSDFSDDVITANISTRIRFSDS